MRIDGTIPAYQYAWPFAAVRRSSRGRELSRQCWLGVTATEQHLAKVSTTSLSRFSVRIERSDQAPWSCHHMVNSDILMTVSLRRDDATKYEHGCSSAVEEGQKQHAEGSECGTEYEVEAADTQCQKSSILLVSCRG